MNTAEFVYLFMTATLFLYMGFLMETSKLRKELRKLKAQNSRLIPEVYRLEDGWHREVMNRDLLVSQLRDRLYREEALHARTQEHLEEVIRDHRKLCEAEGLPDSFSKWEL